MYYLGLMEKISAIVNHRRFEQFVFCLLVLLISLSFFRNEYFISADGSSHLYNAHVAGELLTESNSSYAAYFQLNPIIVPNWSGHAILYFFDLFMPINAAEKSMLFMYSFLLFYSLRYAIKSFKSDHGFYALFCIPFVMNGYIFKGFYNFLLAFIFLFIILGFFKRYWNQLNVKRIIILSLLFIGLYFSHLLVLFLSLVFVFIMLIWFVLIEKESWKLRFSKVIKYGLKVFLAMIPMLILTVIYLQNHGESELKFLSVEKLMQIIWKISPLLGIGTGEFEMVQFYMILLISFGLLSIIYQIKNKTGQLKLKQSDVFLIFTLIAILFYFTFPDSDGKGGFISERFLLVALFAFTLRITLLNLPHWFMIGGVILVCITGLNQMKTRQVEQELLSGWANETADVGNKIKDHSTVLPLCASNHWMIQNLFNYLSTNKSLIMLMNYEAAQPFFPLRWKEDTPIQESCCIEPESVCNTHLSKLEEFEIIPDYVFIYGFDERPVTCWPNNFSKNNYKITYQSEFCILYESNTQ